MPLALWKKSYDSFSRHRIKKQRQRSSKALPTKVHIVKAMVFPLAKNGCESWIIKKAEHQRMDAFNCGTGEESGGEGDNDGWMASLTQWT